jgi:flagellar biosynthesis protein
MKKHDELRDAGLKAAVAVGYKPEEGTPRILAKGRGREAERIIALAQEAEVEIVEDSALTALLSAEETGALVPVWCWEALAKILAFVMSKDNKNV